MTIFLWRSLLIISFGLVGMYLGSWVGATFFVPKSAGLAGGAMVLMYLILGFVVCAIAGAVVAFRLHGRALRKAALITGCSVLLFYLVLAVIALTNGAAGREPDAAFAPAGNFAVTMERVDTSDPYLFVKMHVDSKTRTWAQTGPAPEHKICSAKIMAKNLVEIRGALDTLLALGAEKLADCKSADQPVVKRLHWDLIDGQMPQGGSVLPQMGTLEVNSNCLRRHFDIARTFSLVEKITQQPGGKVTCK
jgi:hypothetical protein